MLTPLPEPATLAGVLALALAQLDRLRRGDTEAFLAGADEHAAACERLAATLDASTFAAAGAACEALAAANAEIDRLLAAELSSIRKRLAGLQQWRGAANAYLSPPTGGSQRPGWR